MFGKLNEKSVYRSKVRQDLFLTKMSQATYGKTLCDALPVLIA